MKLPVLPVPHLVSAGLCFGLFVRHLHATIAHRVRGKSESQSRAYQAQADVTTAMAYLPEYNTWFHWCCCLDSDKAAGKQGMQVPIYEISLSASERGKPDSGKSDQLSIACASLQQDLIVGGDVHHLSGEFCA